MLENAGYPSAPQDSEPMITLMGKDWPVSRAQKLVDELNDFSTKQKGDSP